MNDNPSNESEREAKAWQLFTMYMQDRLTNRGVDTADAENLAVYAYAHADAFIAAGNASKEVTDAQ